MATDLTANHLKQNIEQDISNCETLLELLGQEQEELKQRNVDAVSNILEQKVPLLERLESSAKLRQNWAKSANKQNNDEGWAELISNLGGSTIRTEWIRLKALYEDVRKQNEINGKLLTKHQATVTRLLDVMRGKTATPNLYTSSGYSSNRAQGNTLGEA